MLSLLLTTLVPALVPAVSDGIRGLIGKFTGGAGAMPQNIDEVIKLMSAETEKLKALAALDTPTGSISIWVANIRALQRPFAVAAVVLVWGACAFTKVDAYAVDVVNNLASAVIFYLFGDRTYAALKGSK